MCMKKFSIRNSHAGKALGAKGVYITLAACLLALGGAGIAAYNKAMEDITDNLTISSVDSTAPKQADNKKTDVKKDESSKPDVDIQTQPNVMPVNGEILESFSNGELVKSETLGYWKTHDGVDIKADLGEPVIEITKLDIIKTVIVVSPIPIPLVAEVVTARVGHIPSINTKVGFSLMIPLYKGFKYFFIFSSSFQ